MEPVYYKMGIAISSVSQFEMELQRAKVLEHDLIKSYVRLPDPQQKRMVEFAHASACRSPPRDLSRLLRRRRQHGAHLGHQPPRLLPKMATPVGLRRRRAAVREERRIFCPMISGAGARRLFELDPALKNDARFKLYPEWIQRQVAAQPGRAIPAAAVTRRAEREDGAEHHEGRRTGGGGTDTPNAVNLHGELMSYTMAGMSAFDALKTATVNPAKALNLNAGTIEAGKLADLIVIDGDPLENIATPFASAASSQRAGLRRQRPRPRHHTDDGWATAEFEEPRSQNPEPEPQAFHAERQLHHARLVSVQQVLPRLAEGGGVHLGCRRRSSRG